MHVCVRVVAQLCLTLCDPMDCSLPGSSVYGILQARIPQWVAIPTSGDLPDPGIEPESALSKTCLFIYLFIFFGCILRNPSSPPGMERVPWAVDVWSPTRWTTGEDPSSRF